MTLLKQIPNAQLQDAEGVTVSTTDMAGKTTALRARCGLACDSGSSGMRHRLGVRMLGDTLDTRT